MMTRSLHCILTEVRDLPTYDGLSEVDTFLDKFEREVPEKQHFPMHSSCVSAQVVYHIRLYT